MKGGAVYEQLRDDLVAGAFPPGERLSEAQIGQRYAVSRTPVREALSRLAHEGLVHRVGSTITVPAPTIEEILDLFDARAGIEADLAACAAVRRREGDLVVLEGAAGRCRALSAAADAAERASVNRAFHHALSGAAHNTVLASLQHQLDLRVAALRSTTLTAPGRWDASNDQHDALVVAIAAGDADGAAREARRHLGDARALWLDLVRSGALDVSA